MHYENLAGFDRENVPHSAPIDLDVTMKKTAPLCPADLFPDQVPSTAAAPETPVGKPPAAWHVRTSSEQITKAGEPIGFRHSLMYCEQVMQTGVGADADRTFRAQAEFLNSAGAPGPARAAVIGSVHEPLLTDINAREMKAESPPTNPSTPTDDQQTDMTDSSPNTQSVQTPAEAPDPPLSASRNLKPVVVTNPGPLPREWSPEEIRTQTELCVLVKGFYTEADRLVIYRATKSGELQRVAGPRTRDVCYNVGAFVKYATRNGWPAKPAPVDVSGTAAADGSEVVGAPSTLADVEVVEDKAAPVATSALACVNLPVDPVGPSPDEMDVQRLNDVVREGYSKFSGVGLALKESKYHQTNMTESNSNALSAQPPGEATNTLPMSIEAQNSPPGDPAASEMLPDDVSRFLAEQEAAVGRFVKATDKFKTAKAAVPGSKRVADKAGVEAAEALYRIRVFKGDAPWRAFKTIEQYCKITWGLGKSHTFRLLDLGDFITRFKAFQSPKVPFGDWLPVSESHVRALLTTVPESQQVACWAEIVAKTSPDRLTASLVKTAALDYVRRQSGEPVLEQVPKQEIGKWIAKPVDEIRAFLDGAVKLGRVKPGHVEYFLAGIFDLAADADGSDTAGDADSCPAAACDDVENIQADTAEAEPDTGTSDGAGRGERATPKTTTVCGKVAHSRSNRAKGTAKPLVPVVAADGTRTSEVGGKAEAGPSHPACPPLSSYMNSRLFHSVLKPPADYDDWLATVQADRPHFFHDPGDGGDALISLERAKAIAFLDDNSPFSRLALTLVVRALNEFPNNNRAAADTLFTDVLLGSGISTRTAAP